MQRFLPFSYVTAFTLLLIVSVGIAQGTDMHASAPAAQAVESGCATTGVDSSLHPTSTSDATSTCTGSADTPAPSAPTTSDPTTSSTLPGGSPAPDLFVTPSGSDANVCSQAAPCASLNGAYQRAAAGAVVQVASGTYPYQAIQPRSDLRNLSPGCTPANTAQCVHFLLSGVTINGSLEVFGSDIWLDGGTDRANPGVVVSGNIDSSTGSSCCAPPTTYPDHLFFQGTRSATFGIFATDTMTWRDFDVGPATVSTNCQVKEGPGAEPMIGPSGVGPFVVPRNITIDGMRLHGQNGDSGRIAEDCHWGGLFLDSANGLTIKNSVFEKNVVYNVEIQNFGGAPPATNVTFDSNSFGCPVDWLYNGAGCDGQSSIQFDGTFPGVTITGNTFADGNGGWGCYRSPCDFSGDTFVSNVVSPAP